MPVLLLLVSFLLVVGDFLPASRAVAGAFFVVRQIGIVIRPVGLDHFLCGGGGLCVHRPRKIVRDHLAEQNMAVVGGKSWLEDRKTDVFIRN